jgi:hypothetical protein
MSGRALATPVVKQLIRRLDRHGMAPLTRLNNLVVDPGPRDLNSRRVVRQGARATIVGHQLLELAPGQILGASSCPRAGRP